MIRILTIGLLIFFAAPSLACNSAALVDEIYLEADESVPQKDVLLSGEQGQSVLCRKNVNFEDIFDEAKKNLKYQQSLLRKFRRQGKLRKGEYKHYKNYFSDLASNIKKCQRYVSKMQKTDVPLYKERVRFLTKENGVTHMNVHHPVYGDPAQYISHIVWLGKLLADEGLHLCEAKFGVWRHNK